jgi:O-glycosyl hydrolase
MSEYCILGGNGVLKGDGCDLGIETALFVANIIHNDLAVANASAWQWWLAVSPYDFKDGLVYIDKSEKGGNIYESKLLWALGNYSRFIRPGAKRISIEIEDNSELKISAFQNENGTLVLVIINRGNNAKNIQLNFLHNYKNTAKLYETSENKNLSVRGNINLTDPIQIPQQSITTVLITQ